MVCSRPEDRPPRPAQRYRRSPPASASRDPACAAATAAPDLPGRRRRRVQQDTLGHRGHKHDPLYRIGGLLRHGAEHLSPRQHARLDAALTAGDPNWEVSIAWQCYQQLRSIYHAPTPATGRKTAEKVIASFPTCPIPEVARLGRTLRAW